VCRLLDKAEGKRHFLLGKKWTQAATLWGKNNLKFQQVAKL
jgi:hypothetical protein